MCYSVNIVLLVKVLAGYIITYLFGFIQLFANKSLKTCAWSCHSKMAAKIFFLWLLKIFSVKLSCFSCSFQPIYLRKFSLNCSFKFIANFFTCNSACSTWNVRPQMWPVLFSIISLFCLKMRTYWITMASSEFQQDWSCGVRKTLITLQGYYKVIYHERYIPLKNSSFLESSSALQCTVLQCLGLPRG